MKQLQNLVAVAASLVVLNACAPAAQQPWNDQTYAGGNPQQPYGYGNQPSSGYGNQTANPISSALGMAAQYALINILTGQLGISQQQAMGGAGSIFQLAQQRLQPGEFSKLSSAVPGMDRYLAAVPQQVVSNGSNNMWSAAGNLMGGQNSNLGSLMALAGSFQSLGMNADMISRFVPVMLQYVQQQGGATTMGLLQNALR